MATYKMLQSGSSGSDVKKLQQKLVDAGYDVGSAGVDGIYGKDTESAVRKYQQKMGLAVDGIAGDQTLGSLYKNTTAAPTVPNTQTTPALDLSQYSYDPSANDAYQKALEALQQAQGQLPGYAGTYDKQLEDLYNKISNREQFTYDLNGDALYQQYKDQNTQQGKMAMMDTMGQAAALTGGYGNSYAQNAGQQAYQGYLQNLNDVVPELYGMALDQYNQEGDRMLQQYSMLGDMANTEYSRYMDELNQYWQNLNFQKQQADDAYNRGYDEWLSAYQIERDKVADEQWQKEFDEAKRQYDQEYAFAQQQYSDSKKTSGSTGGGDSSTDGGSNPSESYDTHGYTPEEIKQIQRKARITVDGVWGPQTEKAYQNGYRPDGGKLSGAGETFMKNLPYPHAGSDINTWKGVVDTRLEKALNDGTLSESDVMIILERLNLA